MNFVVLVAWTIISILARLLEQISTADGYIGMTIFLAVIYIEQTFKKGTR